MKSHSGPEWDWLTAEDPEFKRLHTQLVDAVFEPGDAPALPARYRAMIVSVIMAHRHYPAIGTHLRRAVHHGATVRELIEAMEAASIPGGFTCLHFALPHLMAIQEDIDSGRPVYQEH